MFSRVTDCYSFAAFYAALLKAITQAIATHVTVAWSVRLTSVCRMSHSCTLLKPFTRNKMSIGRDTRVVPSNIENNTILDRGPVPHGKVRFGSQTTLALVIAMMI